MYRVNLLGQIWIEVCNVAAVLELLASENTVIGQFCEDWQHAKNNFGKNQVKSSAQLLSCCIPCRDNTHFNFSRK